MAGSRGVDPELVFLGYRHPGLSLSRAIALPFSKMGGFARKKSGPHARTHTHPNWALLLHLESSRLRVSAWSKPPPGCSSRPILIPRAGPPPSQPRPPPSRQAYIPPHSGKGCRAAQPWGEKGVEATRTWASANFPRDFLPHVPISSVDIETVALSLPPLRTPSWTARVVLWSKVLRPADRADDDDDDDDNEGAATWSLSLYPG
ncbi:hypothetical protein LX32DRAFT_119497 [Colletotrichum zoysiae]|uniref:Uncharacterized protein n=1 Tax=Colletotrichum zoysiae TaxID=1216348 RepID=A0AAD9LVT3_9PEZI|nr:hypothetical protein LX32DRAFT_119497 [Colletotrichum zoysiae]